MDNKTINYISPTILKIHPRNQEFFDDVVGEDYERFKQSIKNEGVLSPLIVTSDMTIISGHQRYRAAKELGLITVPVIIREDLTDEDNVLKALIAANFGRIQKNEEKLNKAITEYVVLCGYKNGEIGNGRKKECQFGTPTQKFTLDEIADQLGTSKRNLQRALSIERNLTDPMKELLYTGVISKTVAADVIASLSEAEQEELVSTLDATKKYTQKQIQEYIKQLSSAQNLVADYKKDNIQLQQRLDQVNVDNRKLRSENETLKQQRTETVIKEVQIENPETLKKIKELETELKAKKADNVKLADDLIEAHGKLSQAMGINTNFQLVSHCSEITLKMLTFVKEMSQYDYMSESFNEIPTATRSEYRRCVLSVYKWADRILKTINEKDKEYEAQNVVIDVE